MKDMEDIEEGMMVFLGLLLSEKSIKKGECESGKNPGDSGNKDLRFTSHFTES